MNAKTNAPSAAISSARNGASNQRKGDFLADFQGGAEVVEPDDVERHEMLNFPDAKYTRDALRSIYKKNSKGAL